MPRGGARNRSGPAPAPTSGRSERRGYKLTALPSEGYQDPAPKFPLPRTSRGSEPATRRFRAREVQVWEQAWTTPQACAWAMEPWRHDVVAEYCRLKTVGELEPDAPAAPLPRPDRADPGRHAGERLGDRRRRGGPEARRALRRPCGAAAVLVSLQAQGRWWPVTSSTTDSRPSGSSRPTG